MARVDLYNQRSVVIALPAQIHGIIVGATVMTGDAMSPITRDGDRKIENPFQAKMYEIKRKRHRLGLNKVRIMLRMVVGAIDGTEINRIEKMNQSLGIEPGVIAGPIRWPLCRRKKFSRTYQWARP